MEVTGGGGTREEGEGEVGDVVAGNVSCSFPRHMISVSVAVKGPGMTNRLFRLYNMFFCAPIKQTTASVIRDNLCISRCAGLLPIGLEPATGILGGLSTSQVHSDGNASSFQTTGSFGSTH